MGFPRFYTDQAILETTIISGSRAHYIRNVLRLGIGDQLSLFNGKGGEYKAQISSLSKHEITLEILDYSSQNRQSELKIELGLGVIKRDAMDAAIQKATELGAAQIQPLYCHNNTVSPKGLDKRLRHWREISINACEQCGLNRLPVIASPINALDWFEKEGDLKLIASPFSNRNLAQINLAQTNLAQKKTEPRNVHIAIGPEGGFTEAEIQSAIDKGFKSVKVGTRILRADTAVTTLMSLTQFLWGDL